MGGAAAIESVPAAPAGRRRKLLLAAVPLVLALVGAGLWFTGILPRLLHGTPKAQVEASGPPPPVFVELPEMVANLNAGPRRDSYVKLRARLQLASAGDQAAAQAAMPRLLDLFQTYLRDMRPEELRGSLGTWRLHEELLARANAALAPVHVTAVLFTELLVQ